MLLLSAAADPLQTCDASASQGRDSPPLNEAARQEWQRSVDAVVRSKIQRDSISGLAISVLSNGEPVFARCYGFSDRRHRVCVTPSTVFALASLTKIFTSLAVMVLVDEKALQLNDPVPLRLSTAPQSWHDISIRHLLSHTSGLPLAARNKQAFSGLCKELPARRFLAGQRVEYNNVAYVIAGQIVEHVSGRRLSLFLKQHIFAPLSMHNTAIPAQLFPKNMALGYRLAKGRIVEYKNNQPWALMGGSGGVVSTIGDLEKFEKAWAQKKVFSCPVYTNMERAVLLSNGAPAGWSCSGELVNTPEGVVLTKNGNISGYSSWYARGLRDNFSVIILSNTGHVKYGELDAHIRQLWRRLPCQLQRRCARQCLRR